MPINLPPPGARVDLPGATPALDSTHARGPGQSPLAALRLAVGQAGSRLADRLGNLVQRGTHISRPTLLPRTAFDRPMPLSGTMHALPDNLWEHPDVHRQVEAMAAELADGYPLSNGHGAVAGLTEALRRQMPPDKTAEAFALALSDSAPFKEALLGQLLALRPEATAAVRQAFAEPSTQQALQTAWDRAVDGVLDKDLSRPDETAMTRIEIGGRPYVLEQRLGQGHFGRVDLYVGRKLDKGVEVPDPKDRVVLKTPLGEPGDRSVRFDEPTREGLAVIRAMGSDAGADHITPLAGVVRTPDGVHLAFRVAEHGSLNNALPRLRDANGQPQPPLSDTDLTRFKLLMMLDIATGLQRLQEAKGITHADLATRNVLLTAEGKAQIADFGMAREADTGHSAADAAYPAIPGGAPMPVRWSSPETIRNDARQTGSDTWSLGQTMVELVTDGGLPMIQQFTRNADVVRGLAALPPGGRLTTPAIDAAQMPGLPEAELRTLHGLVQQTMLADPSQRIGMTALREGLLGILRRTSGDPSGGPDIGALRQRVSAALAADPAAPGGHVAALNLPPQAPATGAQTGLHAAAASGPLPPARSTQVESGFYATDRPLSAPSTQVRTGFYISDGSAQRDRDPPGALPSTAGSHRGADEAPEGGYQRAADLLPPQPPVQAQPGVDASGRRDDPNYEIEAR